jgi:hypothetical protein
VQLFLEALQPPTAVLDRLNGVLEDNLLGRMLERLCGEPACMRVGPMLATAIDPAVAQKKGKKLLDARPVIAASIGCVSRWLEGASLGVDLCQ